MDNLNINIMKTLRSSAAKFLLLGAMLEATEGRHRPTLGGHGLSQRTMSPNNNGSRTRVQNLKRRRKRKLTKQARRINRK